MTSNDSVPDFDFKISEFCKIFLEMLKYSLARNL
jgi:hypothetical protein